MKYKIYNYILLLICLVSISGAFVYKIYRLNNLGVFFSILLVILLFTIILFLQKKLKEEGLFVKNQATTVLIDDYTVKPFKIQARGIWLLAIYFSLIAFGFFTLLRNQSDLSLISPWESVPKYFFLIYFLATVFLYLNTKENVRFAIYLFIIHYFFSFGIALIIYKLGFGYDPFVHTATMEYISEFGQALPKPFYYLGYYALILITHKLTFIPLAFLSKAIVPLLASLLLPPAIYLAGKKWFKEKEGILFSILFLLIFPFGIFIISTPQNLAYLFLALILFYGVTVSSYLDRIIIIALGLAALSFQPITGLPAFCLSLAIILHHSRYFKSKKFLFTLLLLFNTLILPLIFYYITSASIQNNTLTPKPDRQGSISSLISLNWAGQENAILNYIYFIIFNFRFLLLILIISGLVIIYKYKDDCRILTLYSSFAPSLLLSWLITSFLPFNFLIAYEQNNYSDRILVNAGLFLLPMLFVVGHALFLKIQSFDAYLRNIFLLSLAVLIIISLYQSYPRFDSYFNTHGYSVSQLDVLAVNWIKNDAKGDYIVLANQQVSAAALKEFGFSKYYKPNPLFIQTKNPGLNPDTDIFYYPVPTGGPLYPYYLKMVDEKPNRATILEAMDLTGVHEGYFVLNKYWWAFSKILDEAKMESDGVEVFGNNEVVVFRYNE